MRSFQSIILLALLSCGGGAGAVAETGGPKGSEGSGSAGYDPYQHPCKADGDCSDGQYCHEIGVGIVPADAPRSTAPEQKYCLRKNSGDCCPPSAPARPL